MKCPKCDYLGFDTGPRCKNCGYDFSLMPALAADVELLRHEAQGVPGELWFDQIDRALGQPLGPSPTVPSASLAAERAGATALPKRAVPVSRTVEPALPFFPPAEDDGLDERPLVPFPVAPRPPFAVRKTPDVPRLRAVSRTPRSPSDPVLEFLEEAASAPEPNAAIVTTPANPVAPAVVRRRASTARSHATSTATPSTATTRLQALALDHVILLSIDVVVIYFTLRIAALDLASWDLLPAGPLGAFLLLIACAYFTAFTAVGGQTIGKMAMNIRVVGVDDTPVDTARAVRRTLAGLLSSLVLGLGFLPALVGADRRALHDRMAQTRVISLSKP